MTDRTEPTSQLSPTAASYEGTERIDPARLRAWTDFLEAHSRLMRLLERDLKASHGLTLSEYDVLHRLEEAGDKPVRMSALAQALLYTTGGLTRLIDRMQDRGLIDRSTSPADRRVVHVVLTSHGLETLRQAAGTHLRGLQRYFGQHLPEGELHAVGTFMQRLVRTGDGGSL
ncbi:MarR family winged helix-turn-helix transcriptional regulator [Nesterenkonia flava]|uniref:MarR family transcriptional regulator n=1 Tax=Nesterenkonia flava TaxID=469799 RepID=A0ABU1FT52_9MICC|nr:MarR family transcriptional regulator [Nesterenkonia flava]MDR5711841.1 MarR family transcriptional regulator [Nesterenkonia flava]